jgi:hypothetical protein
MTHAMTGTTAYNGGKGKKVKTSAKSGPLFVVQWKRVVADEGHVLKNPKAKMTMAFRDLPAERRWVCTGESCSASGIAYGAEKLRYPHRKLSW